MEADLPVIPYDALLALCGRLLATASNLEVRAWGAQGGCASREGACTNTGLTRHVAQGETEGLGAEEVDRWIPIGGLPCLSFAQPPPEPPAECAAPWAAHHLRRAVQALASGDAQAVHAHARAAVQAALSLLATEGVQSQQAVLDCATLGHLLAVVFAPIQPTAGMPRLRPPYACFAPHGGVRGRDSSMKPLPLCCPGFGASPWC